MGCTASYSIKFHYYMGEPIIIAREFLGIMEYSTIIIARELFGIIPIII